MSAHPRLRKLRAEAPAWASWIDLLEIALEALGDPAWDACAAAARPEDELVVDARAADTLLGQLLGASAALRHARGKLDPTRVVEAAFRQDRAALDGLAFRADVMPHALAAVADLAALPLLQACGRRFAERCHGWSQGHCPVCGAWPTLAEMRGLERARRMRCRCGADWGIAPLLCHYCGNRDHRTLIALVPEAGGESRKVDACDACHGYVKSLAQLGPMRPETIAIEDLASVELDLAAVDRGYVRPGRRVEAR